MSRKKSIDSLVFEDMSFMYENGPQIFENITFEIPKSRAVWVRSPGGGGRSTLLKILAGLERPQSGKYLINGKNVLDMSFEEFMGYRLSIGYGFDIGGLLNNKTLFENLMLPLQYHKLISEEEAQERVQSAMEMFGMTRAQDRRPYSVPGSQRKLTCMIRALIHWPQVAFLDDPVTGVKEDNLNDLLYYVEESLASRGLKQVFFTSETPAIAERLNAEELLISCDWFTTRSVA